MSEHDEQAAFIRTIVDTFRLRDDFIRPLFFSVPNGAVLGGNRWALANKLKNEGMYPGVADVLYLQTRGAYVFFAVEMKTEKRRREKNGGLSDKQTSWLKTAKCAGAYIAICYSADEAVNEFSYYMTLEA